MSVVKSRRQTYGTVYAGQALKAYGPAIARAAFKYATSAPRQVVVKEAKAEPLKGRKTYKKKTYKKPLKGRKLSKKVQQCCKQIKELKLSEDASLGTMTHRLLATSRILNAVNTLGVQQFDFAKPEIESLIANLKYYDPSNPGTLITADFSTGNYQRECLLKSVTQSLVVRSNYQLDTRVKIYLCSIKDDTNQDPITAWTAGVIDGGNAAAYTTLNQYPTDYQLFNDVWKTKVLFNKVLAPGQSASVSHTVKNIHYDASTVDTHNVNYQRQLKSFTFLVVSEGTLAHDSALDEQGFTQSGLDCALKQTSVVSYDAGVNIKYIHLVTSVDPFTNVGRQTNQPMADLQSYSLA